LNYKVSLFILSVQVKSSLNLFTKHQTPNTKHQTPNTKHQTPNTKHQTPNTKHLKPAEAYILKQSEPYRSIIMHLQMLIEVTVPNTELLFKWSLPFFYVDQRPICYINQTKGYVDLVFWNAAHFTTLTELLVTDKRKRMKSLRYKSLDEIDDVVVIKMVEQAYHFRNEKFLS